MYKVGQVIYTIIVDKQIVMPLQIIEEVTIKNLEGEETQYKVLLPNNKKQKVNIEKLSNVFVDLDEASAFLLENAKNAIDEMILKAVDLEEKFFVPEKVTPDVVQKCNEDTNKVTIELGDGQKANINIDNLQQYNLQNPNENEEQIEEESTSA